MLLQTDVALILDGVLTQNALGMKDVLYFYFQMPSR